MNYEVEMFYDYVFDYYSKGGIFDLGLNLSKRDIIKYCNMYLADPTTEGVQYDSHDREMVRCIIEKENGLPVTNPYIPYDKYIH
tara:strand:- start:243 stop:494 length:252 start_codon:yes stop_codon:yes gene_type:complete